jgi:dolichol-phosphate hexosyltransferase
MVKNTISNKIDLTIVMPCYNEISTIKLAIEQVLDTLNNREEIIEFIIIDNNSTDGTKEYLYNLNIPLVKIILNNENLGKGGSVQKGISLSKGKYIIIYDADLEYEAKNIWDLYDIIKKGGSSLVLGHRMEGYEINRNIGYFHYYIGVKVLTILINILYRSQISDSATCFKLIDGNLARSIDFYSKGFALDFEIICKVLRMGHSISECPVNYVQRSRKEGKKIRAVDGLIALIVIILERFNLIHIFSK